MLRYGVWIAVALSSAGCGSKKPARDCESYANKVADLSDPAPGHRDQLVEHSVDRCQHGKIPDHELACVDKATTRSQLIECTTGRPAVDLSKTPPPPPVKGTNAVTLYAAQNGDGYHPMDLVAYEDQRQWYDGLKKRVAACATDEVYDPPKEYKVTVTYSTEAPSVSLGDLPAPLSRCVKDVLSTRQPASVQPGPVDFYIHAGS